MKERPILFSGEMVRAILGGEKTQTRRLVKPQDIENVDGVPFLLSYMTEEPDPVALPCPYGAPGDRLWVKETFHACPHCGAGACSYRSGGWLRPPRVDGPEYDETDRRPLNPKCASHGWRPSIHMPRWASRITLAVKAVRVERLNDISEEDARAEGITEVPFYPDEGFPLSLGYMVGRDDKKSTLYPTAVGAFTALWDSINGNRAPWSSNPWVWAVSFERLDDKGAT